MAKCQVCEGRAQLRLCLTHEVILRDSLRDLPWWLERLAEAATGNVRLGDGGRRATRVSELDELAGPDGSDKLARALAANKLRRDRLLAAGRVNAKASRLQAAATNTLTTWVRHLCETRGIDVPRMTAAECAQWLAKHSHAIASDEAAKECHDDIVDLTDRIRRIVNRPSPPVFCGPCPTLLTDEERAKLIDDGEEDREECHTRLYAPPKADQVTCPRCGFEYDVKELQAWCWDNCDDKSFTLVQLCHVVLPPLGHVMKHRTLQRFVRKHEIMPTGQHAHVPTYQLGQVRAALGR